MEKVKFEVKDQALKQCFESGLEAAMWGKNRETEEICGLKLIFENGAELYLGSKDQKEIIIQVINPDGSVQCNIKGTEE